MIKSFADKRTAQIFDGQLVKRIDVDLQKKVLRRLRYIDAAERIEDLRIPPSNKLYSIDPKSGHRFCGSFSPHLLGQKTAYTSSPDAAG